MNFEVEFEKWDDENIFKFQNFALRVKLDGMLDLMNPDNVKFIRDLTNAIYEDKKLCYTAGVKIARKETLENIRDKILRRKKITKTPTMFPYEFFLLYLDAELEKFEE